MDWMTKMNEAIGYIEANLDDEIDVETVGKLAGCSAYHFQRVFSYMAGTTVAEYIRRRRLTRAAFDLQNGDEKVIDIAVKYGYDSPTSFTRAFQTLHGMTPSEAKEAHKPFVAYPPLSFQITIQGVTAMNYRIEEKKAFRIVGASKKFELSGEEAFTAVPQFWGETAQSGQIPQILAQMDQEPMGLLGVSIGDWAKENAFTYMIAVSSDKEVPEGMEAYTVPACTWAIFESVGPLPGALQMLQKRIVTEWLPTSGYAYAQAPDIEVYGEGDQQAQDYRCWAWLPIVKA